MAKVKNLLHQPLILDFGKEVIRFNAREEKTVKDDYLTTPTFKRNEKDLFVFVEPQVAKDAAVDTKPKK